MILNVIASEEFMICNSHFVEGGAQPNNIHIELWMTSMFSMSPGLTLA